MESSLISLYPGIGICRATLFLKEAQGTDSFDDTKKRTQLLENLQIVRQNS